MPQNPNHRSRKQNAILAAARQLFADRGIEETSMDEIASAASYTRRTLYAYFKSKDEICLRVLVEDMHVRWRIQKAAMEKEKCGLGKIRAWAESFFDFASANSNSMHLHLYWDFKGINRDKIGDETFELFEKINDELAEDLRVIFRLGIDDGSLRHDLKVDLCISQFLYTFRAVVHRANSSAYSFALFDAEEYFRHYLEIFTLAISHPERTQL